MVGKDPGGLSHVNCLEAADLIGAAYQRGVDITTNHMKLTPAVLRDVSLHKINFISSPSALLKMLV